MLDRVPGEGLCPRCRGKACARVDGGYRGRVAFGPTAPAGEAGRAIGSVSVLSDGSRRRMYTFVRRVGRAVTRDEAAARVGISCKLAAFHLDKLVDAGLLCARYETPGKIRKVGREPKVYEPTDAQITVSIRDRRQELLADPPPGRGPDRGSRRERGAGGRAQRRTPGPPAGRGRPRGDASRTPGPRTRADRLRTAAGAVRLRTRPPGSRPAQAAQLPLPPGSGCATAPSARLRLRNCPFHPLAAKAPE